MNATLLRSAFKKLNPIAQMLIKAEHICIEQILKRQTGYDSASHRHILCTDKDSITAEYALGGLASNIFTSRYVLYIPDKEQLIAQVEAVLDTWHEGEEH